MPDPLAAVIPGLPMEKLMTDNGDGTYTADYVVSGSAGTVSASVELASAPTIFVEYFNLSGWDKL